MKNGVVTMVVVLFIGVSLILSTALYQYRKKYEAVKSTLVKVENRVDELEEQSGFVLSNKLEERVALHTARISRLEKRNCQREDQTRVEDQKSEELVIFSNRIDSLGAELTRLEKELDSVKKVKPQGGDLLNADLLKDLKKSVDSLKSLLAPSVLSNAPNKRVEKAKSKSLENRTGLRVVTVEELHNAYKENDVAAKHTYGSKYVLLRGVVRSVKGSGNITVVLETKNGWNFIICYFDKSASNSLLGVKKGDDITIKGKYYGYAQFKYCSLVD